MAQLQTTKCAVARLAALVAMITLMAAGVTRSDQASGGQLRIEGQGIKQVVFRDSTGRQKTLDEPGSIVTLPPGEYSVERTTLQGGHYAISPPALQNLRATVDANACATLKMGAPLRQVVRIERQGPVMEIGYELVGQGGESYVIDRSQGSATPAFTVYRGNSKMASGQFEFG
jgi:hypothetical protein